MNEQFDRVLRDRGLVRFQREPWVNPRTGRVEPRVLGKRLPLRWRVARDFWDEYIASVVVVTEGIRVTFGGWPIEPDDTLPAGAVVLDEAL